LGFEPVIGFEIHAQLDTRSKVFCACAVGAGAAPNELTCPVCLGMPGVLPVLNEEVVDLGIRVALALDARIAPTMGFARKNYFYPDLPKGYQITQYAAPLATGGHLDVAVDGGARRVGIVRVHIEEDAGKTVHAGSGDEAASLVDLNRCGVPLIEIVTAPDLRSLDEADRFLTELVRILVFLGVTSGRMHEGNVRFDTNVSVRRAGEERLGTQTEIKNLNSFRAARKALAFEIERQVNAAEAGREVVHETLLWDERAERALPMRSKEEESDYRYFPEPDLGDVVIDEEQVERVRRGMPELPRAMNERFTRSYALPEYDAGVLTADPDTAAYFEVTVHEVVRAAHPELAIAPVGEAHPVIDTRSRLRLSDHPLPDGIGDLPTIAKTVSNWVMVIVGARLKEDGVDVATFASSLPPPRLAEIVRARLDGRINEPSAKALFDAAIGSDTPIESLIESLGLAQLRDAAALDDVVRRVVADRPDEVARYRAGEVKLLGYLMGCVMKETGGRADPVLAKEILKRALGRGAGEEP
jgi:aspartyl-tRNA(Asn)/glutamyl-tRNA(Gln) amidotransferase subunit B